MSSAWRQPSPRRPRCPSSCSTSRSSSWSSFSSPSPRLLAKMVLKVSKADTKKRSKAMKEVATAGGVISVQVEGDRMVVVGDGMDAAELVAMLRKQIGLAELLSIYVGLLDSDQSLYLDS